MSSAEEHSGAQYDAPNQQVVRPDGSAPWDQGEGGTSGTGAADDLDSMTKAQLQEKAAEMGVDVPDTATKAEIKEAITEGQ